MNDYSRIKQDQYCFITRVNKVQQVTKSMSNPILKIKGVLEAQLNNGYLWFLNYI